MGKNAKRIVIKFRKSFWGVIFHRSPLTCINKHTKHSH